MRLMTREQHNSGSRANHDGSARRDGGPPERTVQELNVMGETGTDNGGASLDGPMAREGVVASTQTHHHGDHGTCHRFGKTRQAIGQRVLRQKRSTVWHGK